MDEQKPDLVLVIDDEPSIRESFRDFLEDCGYRVIIAENGRLGLELFRQNAPDIVLVDLRMPEIGGLEVLAEIRKTSPDTPSIVVSGTGAIADAVEALHRGAWDYLLKPISDMSVLLHSVQNSLEKSRLLQENRAYREYLEQLVDSRTGQLTQLNHRLKAITRSTRNITGCSSVSQVGKRILAEFVENMAADAGGFYLVENGSPVLKQTLTRNPRENPVSLPPAISPMAQKALDEKLPVLISQIEELPDGRETASAIAFPFFDSESNALGVASLWKKNGPPFSEQDREIGEILAFHSSEAIKAAKAMYSLEKSEERYRELVENINDALYMADTDGNLIYVSPAIVKITGCSPREVAGKNYKTLFPKSALDTVESAFKQMLEGNSAEMECEILGKSGQPVWTRISGRPVFEMGRITGFQGIVSNITERKKAQMQVEKKAEELSVLNRLGGKIVENLNLAATVRIALEYAYTALCPDLVLLSLKQEELLVLQGIWPPDSPYSKEDAPVHRVGECLCGLAVKHAEPVFSEDIRKDSRCVYSECKNAGFVSFAALPLTSGREIIGVLGIAATAKTEFKQREPFLKALSNQIAMGLKNAMLYEKVKSDASELKDQLQQIQMAEQEKDALARQLRQTQKMEAIGTLAGGIAHDFNNILSGMIGYTELVLHHLSGDREKNRARLYRVVSAGMRARDLVRQILQFSRDQNKSIAPVSLTPLLKEVAKLLRSTFPSTIQILQEFQSDNDCVPADPTRIHQVIMNLCTNAFHAMNHEKGVLTLAMENTTLEDEKTNLAMKIPPGIYVKISVSDTGNGIASEIRERIFDPYFTTKSPEHGTGLGLSVTYGIVREHDGLIEIENTSGNGTTFAVYLPVAENARKDANLCDRVAANGGNQIIMVVDDEEFFLDVLCEHLESLGYCPSGFRNGTEALEELKENPEKYDLIVSDLTMPGITGTRLISEFRKINANTPVILCTGFSETVNEQSAQKYGITKFLMKPVSREELARTVGELLGVRC